MSDLCIKSLSKSFAGVCALDNVDFEASYGEALALLGENGAGKSTLIKCLGGCQDFNSGEIHLDGKTLQIKHPGDAIRAGIGIVFQELSLIPTLSVADNIYLETNVSNKLSITRKRRVRKCTLDIFQKYNITGIDPDAKVEGLSLSDRQMIEIIKILSRDPKVVIFDEATSALGSERVEWLYNISARLVKENRIIVFISHRMAEIRRFCTKVTVFRNGQNVGSRRLDKVDNDELVAMMLGRKITAYYPEKTNSSTGRVLLEVNDLCVRNTIQNVSFNIYEGEVVGVGGLAGQGQSALFLSLFGAIRGKGDIKINGKKMHITSPQKALDAGMVFVPEDRGTEGLVLNLSIYDNILLPSFRKISKFCIIDQYRAESMLIQSMKQFEIKIASFKLPVSSLSGGNQQKVVLAKLILLSPRILLLFDMTRGVDVGTKNSLFVLVRRLAAQGNGVLFYSTDIEELVNICDRVLVMDNGEIKANLADKELSEENILLISTGEKLVKEDTE
jgi:ABC-type sugar transport system ATPase subunit